MQDRTITLANKGESPLLLACGLPGNGLSNSLGVLVQQGVRVQTAYVEAGCALLDSVHQPPCSPVAPSSNSGNNKHALTQKLHHD